MPTWGEILSELASLQKSGHPSPFDFVRRKYVAELQHYSGRNSIIYAVKCTGGVQDPSLVMINDEDIQGIMEVVHGLKGNELDLILLSPGGSAEAAESIVLYLRSKFPDLRIIVPHIAMSAATMMACSANRIVMGKHSFLGPIDPQMQIYTPIGRQMVPAQAILDQFHKAQKECQDPKLLGSWLQILSQYGPALLVQCENAIALSHTLVAEWLEKYMFIGRPDAKEQANRIAGILANHKEFLSHGRHINREKAKGYGLIIEDLESDQVFQDKVLSVFHATTHTLNATNAVT
jgi:hypothetical protein